MPQSFEYIWCLSSQRRTLTISELEGQGELEASISKQVESLETEMGLRSDTVLYHNLLYCFRKCK